MTRDQTLNFAAGPSSLPSPVLHQAALDLLDYQGTGIGITEHSHRSSTFQNLLQRSEQDLRNLLVVPDNFAVLWLQGGGLSQFHQTALNLQAWYRVTHNFTQESVPAEYLVTGSWSSKAAAEAKRLGIQVNVVTDSRKHSKDGKSYGSPASPADYKWSDASTTPAYIYYCANETIHGVEIDPPIVPDHLKDVPIVADMSSNILSKPIPWSSHNFGIIYAGAQKNIGPSGLTIVMVRKDLLVDLDQAVPLGGPRVPAMDSYKIMADNNSLYNTPPMFPIHVAGLVFQHLLKEGGVEDCNRRNQQKADLLYDALDSSDGLYIPQVDKAFRSRMNVVFNVRGGEDIEKKFIAEADKKGIKQIKGHRSVGGIRVSLYNAVTLDMVQTLIKFMNAFKAQTSQ